VFHVLGIDLDHTLIERAKYKFKDTPSVQFIASDITTDASTKLIEEFLRPLNKSTLHFTLLSIFINNKNRKIWPCNVLLNNHVDTYLSSLGVSLIFSLS
jgi:hypothetical protein